MTPDENADTAAADKSAVKARGLRFVVLSYLPYALLLLAALFLLTTNFQPARFIGWITGPSGKIYVSSPGVYTRERLVNDRNDQDFWLRAQLKDLDADTREIPPSEVSFEDTRFRVGTADRSRPPVPPPAAAPPPAPPGTPATASPPPPATNTPPPTRPRLSFVDSYAIRAAARDLIRQSVLENLLDDRHDLTGNSVYGLKFDTTIYPSRFTTGRAFVRLSITADQSDLIVEKDDPEQRKYPDLPYHLQTYYKSTYSDIKNNPGNPNYNSFALYEQWLHNVSWRLNSHFLQLMESKRTERCADAHTGWAAEIVSTVNTVLALDNAKLSPTDFPSGQPGQTQKNVDLPAPWSSFLQISVRNSNWSNCENRPEFDALGVSDTIYIRAGNRVDVPSYAFVDVIDGSESAYVPSPRELYQPRYRNIRAIARYLKDMNALDYTDEKNAATCKESNNSADDCERYFSIPSGYFNFIEKVIKPDMYAYSLFPRMEADSILRTHTQAVDIANPGDGGDGDSGFSLGRSNSRVRAGLEAVAVGFTDSQSTKSIDFGWVVDVGDFGASFQKSQFALISVPAWTSRLAITVKTGWLGSNSQENSTASYTYSVPIPPDYEAFDAFIGGEEAVRRPQINDELMDPRIDLIACRKASILIPGLRLWRSAMVTVGSERADRITVLPNMRGIIAEFTKLPPPANLGPDVPKVVVPLRVWTSEGVDTQLDKITIRLPQNINECDDNPDIAKASATSSQMNPTSGNAATVPIQR